MILKLTQLELTVTDKITWKEIFEYEKLLKRVSLGENESFEIMCFFINKLILEVKYKDSTITKKDDINELIFNPEVTTLDDWDTLNSELGDYIKKKVH